MKQQRYFSFLAIICLYASMSCSLLAQTSRPEQTLNARQQKIVSIAAYTGKGDLEHLKSSLTEGLEVLSVNEIKVILVHSYAYCGFPRSLRGLQTFIA